MPDLNRSRFGFTLLELLAAVAVILVLALLLLAVMTKARSTAGRTVCLNNLRNINLAVRLYAQDHDGMLVIEPDKRLERVDYHVFKERVKSYLGLVRSPSPRESIFACPADTFYYSASGHHPTALHGQPWTDYCSYAFNGMNFRDPGETVDPPIPGLSGKRIAQVAEPTRTVLVCEFAAMTPFSWHDPGMQKVEGYRFRDSRNMLSFVDGHAGYVAMYWGGSTEAWRNDPPPGYEYRWSAN